MPAPRAAMPPQLLVSVQNATEAQAAQAGGADWIDLKQPARGALGPVDAAAARDVAQVLPRGTRLSAAAGELRDWSDGAGRALLDVPPIEMVKLGLAGLGDEATAWRPPLEAAAAATTAAGKQLVLAAYADAHRAESPAPAIVRDVSAALGLRWLLIDTFDKTAGGLLDHLPSSELARFLASCRACGLHVAVAGRLRADDLALLPLPAIDVLGVRSAACGGNRHGAIDAHAVRDLQARLQQTAAGAQENCKVLI